MNKAGSSNILYPSLLSSHHCGVSLCLSGTPTPLFVNSPESEKTRWFTEELQPHEPALRAYLQSKFPSLSDVDDVVQEAYIKLLRVEEKGKISCAKAYLFSVARNVAFGIFRKKRLLREITINGLDDSFVLSHSDATETVNSSQELALAIQAIDQLPARCREVMTLRMLQGCSHREIAVRLNISEQTVRVQVMRGLSKCTDFLRKRGVIKSSTDEST